MGKVCTKCKIEKGEAYFGNDKRLKCGLMSICKSCKKIYRTEYINSNRENINDKRRSYQKEYMRAWYLENKQTALEIAKRCRIKNKVKNYFTTKQYRLSNPMKVKAWNARAVKKDRFLVGKKYVRDKAKRRGFTVEQLKTRPKISDAIKLIIQNKRLCRSKTSTNY